MRAWQSGRIAARPARVLMVVLVMGQQWVVFRRVLYSRCVGLVCLGRRMSCAPGVSLAAAAAACVDGVVVAALANENLNKSEVF